MNPFEDLARAFYAPGRLGRDLGSPGAHAPPAELATRIVLFVGLPAVGFGWVLLYALVGATSFTLSLQFGEPVDLDFVTMEPFLLVPALAGLVAGAFWLIPTALFFAFNAALPANRREVREGFFCNFVAATSPSFGIHLAFLALSFWLMTSQATFFWGLRTVEDAVFTMALLTSLALQLASLFVTSKNYFARGLGGSIAALIVIVTALVALLYTLLS
ncbi:MAG: hypothetical protein JW839_13920 [Candidatus Lokiarchaeota archaeon]|nr:hypothetical protein [Candidatus Lokiarchaeota archaeon]